MLHVRRLHSHDLLLLVPIGPPTVPPLRRGDGAFPPPSQRGRARVGASPPTSQQGLVTGLLALPVPQRREVGRLEHLLHRPHVLAH